MDVQHTERLTHHLPSESYKGSPDRCLGSVNNHAKAAVADLTGSQPRCIIHINVRKSLIQVPHLRCLDANIYSLFRELT